MYLGVLLVTLTSFVSSEKGCFFTDALRLKSLLVSDIFLRIAKSGFQLLLAPRGLNLFIVLSFGSNVCLLYER